MSDREIMQQALEALLHMCNTTKAQNDYNAKIVDKALVALEAALAQPEQEFKYTPYGLRSDENGKLSIGEISQREWVGLTHDDIENLWNGERWSISDFVIPFTRAIEAKLKEKNNGSV